MRCARDSNLWRYARSYGERNLRIDDHFTLTPSTPVFLAAAVSI